jgi:hypothetical protein
MEYFRINGSWSEMNTGNLPAVSRQAARQQCDKVRFDAKIWKAAIVDKLILQ